MRSPVAILPSRVTKRPGLPNASVKLRPTPCSSSWSGKVADALTSPSSPGTITRSMLPWARSATRSTRLDGSPPQCTEPPWFTTCLLAERAEELGLSQHEGRRDYFTSRLDQWRDEIEEHELREWNLEQLWALVARQGKPVSPPTRAFVSHWVSLLRGPSGLQLAGDQTARNLIREREIHQKRGQARLTNDRLMRQWGGASGSGRLNFRWPVVARLLNDIAEGRK